MPRTPDHLVYAVPDLDAAIRDFTDLLGVAPVFGGYHRERGTKNALLNLGEGCYLEIIAADPENTAVPPPRWMGVDVLTRPRLTRWCLKSDDLSADGAILAEYDSRLNEVWQGSRLTAAGELLAWQMLLPLPEPEVEIMPFMVDWSSSAFHPTERLPVRCRLAALTLSHPEPARVRPYLQRLGLEMPVTEASETIIGAELSTPLGIIKI